MKVRTLGRTGIQVTELGFGSWAIGGDAWGPQDDAASIAALNDALDLGCNFIDTALSYGSGHSEEIIGRVLKQRGQNVVLATKVPPKNELWGPPPYQSIDEEFPPEWIVECCERSLKNLGVECIDVLLLHTWNMAWSHRTEWYEAMEQLKTEGKIKACGISVHDELVSQANVHIEAERVDVIEVVYNVFQQLPAYEVFPLAEKHNVGVIARAPLQAGILTGKFTAETTFPEEDWRGDWTPADWLAQNLAMTAKVAPIARSTGLSMGTVALKFALSHPAVSVVIAGCRNPRQVKENFAATEALPLSSSVMDALYDLWKEGEVGSTYLGSS